MRFDGSGDMGMAFWKQVSEVPIDCQLVSEIWRDNGSLYQKVGLRVGFSAIRQEVDPAGMSRLEVMMEKKNSIYQAWHPSSLGPSMQFSPFSVSSLCFSFLADDSPSTVYRLKLSTNGYMEVCCRFLFKCLKKEFGTPGLLSGGGIGACT